jgi:hypothetical protein
MLSGRKGVYQMARITILLIAAVLIGVPLIAQGGTVMEFDTMVGVFGPFIDYPIRYIVGGGMAWMVGEGTNGFLDSDGRLSLDIRGLVLKGTGENPVPLFYGFVSCLTKGMDEMGMPRVVVKNLVTEGFPADMQGNAMLDTMVMLPKACVAPIILVGTIRADGTNVWFASTGVKSMMEEEVEEEMEPEEMEMEVEMEK